MDRNYGHDIFIYDDIIDRLIDMYIQYSGKDAGDISQEELEAFVNSVFRGALSMIPNDIRKLPKKFIENITNQLKG